MNTVINDKFVSIVRAHKFCVGDISDYMVVDDAIHFSNGGFYDVYKNPMNSANIQLSWNVAVTPAVTTDLRHLSKNLPSQKPAYGIPYTL